MEEFYYVGRGAGGEQGYDVDRPAGASGGFRVERAWELWDDVRGRNSPER